MNQHLQDLIVEVAQLKKADKKLAESLLLKAIQTRGLSKIQLAVLENSLRNIRLDATESNNTVNQRRLEQYSNTHREGTGTTTPINSLVINFLDIDFERTLGVLRIGHELLDLLCNSRLEKIFALLPSDQKQIFQDTTCGRVRVIDTPPLDCDGELLLHQFQNKRSNSKYKFVLVHDFHAFDIPWKYSNSHSMQSKILNNIYTSDIVFSHFPFTYQRIKELSPRKAIRLHLRTTFRKASHQEISQKIRGLVAKSQVNIFCPAQFQAHKDHITILRAFHALNNPAARLHFTGSVFRGAESYYECFINAIEELRLADRVSVLGNVSEVELDHLYSNSDIVIQSGTAEGGALIAQEALSYGKVPIVCGIPPAKAHLKEIDTEGIAYSYEPGDFLDLKSKIQQALLRDSYPTINCLNQEQTSSKQISEIFCL